MPATYRDPASFNLAADVRGRVEQRQASKGVVHLAVMGHVDAGKSTLVGRLLHDMGALDAAVVRKNMQEAKNSGKASFGWAWAFDERPEERARGLTMDVSSREFESAKCARSRCCAAAVSTQPRPASCSKLADPVPENVPPLWKATSSGRLQAPRGDPGHAWPPRLRAADDLRHGAGRRRDVGRRRVTGRL